MARLSVEIAVMKQWHRGAMVWAVLLALVAALFFLGATSAAAESEASQARAQEEPMKNGNPIANYWRNVRGGEAGITTESGPYTTNTLIQNGGQNWRQIRNGLIANYGGWLLGLALAGIALFFAVRGRVRIEEGYSGKRVMRFSLWQRIVHWFMATIFVLLALTGLVLLFGRALLIPLLGKDSFSVLADVFKLVHNFLGPLFIVAVLMLLVTFAADNLYRKGDLKWFTSGGGMLKGKHTSAGRYNAGEKSWFWLAIIAGTMMAVSGVVLDFPGYGQTRELMQLAHIVHAGTAMIFIAASFGHIYIGTLGMEGSIDAMAKGHVDANWAKQHHDQWYAEMEKRGMVEDAMGPGQAEGTTTAQPDTPS